MHAMADKTEVVICAPFVFLPGLSQYCHALKLGAQNMSWADKGALTGEISGQQLNQFNISYVIIGHSERRLYLGETNSVANAKIIAALKAKITPIVCLGSEEIGPQFAEVTKDLDESQLKKIVYVYEPTHAISTMPNSRPETGEEAEKAIRHIYELLEHRIGKSAHMLRVLYGGTVNKTNVAEYAKFSKIDGALVGAASLDSENFWEVVKEFNRESVHHE